MYFQNYFSNRSIRLIGEFHNPCTTFKPDITLAFGSVCVFDTTWPLML